MPTSNPMKALIVVPLALAALAACNRPDADGREPPLRAVLAGFPKNMDLVAWSPDESMLVVRHSRRCVYLPRYSDSPVQLCVFAAEAVDIATGRRTLLTRHLDDVQFGTPDGVPVLFAPTGRSLLIRGVQGLPDEPDSAVVRRDGLIAFQEWVHLGTGERRRIPPGPPMRRQNGELVRYDGGDVLRFDEYVAPGGTRPGLFRWSTGAYTPLPAELRGDWWNTHIAADGRSWYYVPEGGGLWAGGFDQTPRLIAPRVNTISVRGDGRSAVVQIGDPPAPGTSPLSGAHQFVTLPDFKPIALPDAERCEGLGIDESGHHVRCSQLVQPPGGGYPSYRYRIWNSFRRAWLPAAGWADGVNVLHEGRTITYTPEFGRLCAVAAEDGRETCADAPTMGGVDVQAERADRTVTCGGSYFAQVCIAVGRGAVAVSPVIGEGLQSSPVLRGLTIDAAGDTVRGMYATRTGPDVRESTSALWEWHIPTNTTRLLWRGPNAWPGCTPQGVCAWGVQGRTAVEVFMLNTNAPADRTLRRRVFPVDAVPITFAARRRIAVALGDGTITIEPLDTFGEVVPPLDEPAGGDLDWDPPADEPGRDF